MQVDIQRDPQAKRFTATIDGVQVGYLAYATSRATATPDTPETSRAPAPPGAPVDRRSGDAGETAAAEQVWTTYTTRVDPSAEGRGVGSALTRAAAVAATQEGARINPTCWFVAGWLDRHSEFMQLRI